MLNQKITIKRTSQSDLVFDQLYSYDSLNRITSAEEKTGTTVNWNQTYTFDRYGNRNFNESLTTTLPKGCLDGSEPVMCAAERNVYNPTLNAANNRMAGGQGWAYDATGNVVTDAEGRTFTYDGENKQIEVKNSSNATVGQYFFDGDGKRIKKVVPSTGETTIFIYDAGAKLIGEYSTIIATTEDAKVQYLTNDHLGSPRIKTDKNGSVTSRTDYMPYGEEIIANGGRTSDESYVADDVRQGFTGYEHDEETGLDFAQARFHNSQLGRFMSPDYFAFDTNKFAPQSWNLYLYARNNPLKYSDPGGRELYVYVNGKEYKVERSGAAFVLQGNDGSDAAVEAVQGLINRFASEFGETVQRLVGNKHKNILDISVNDDDGPAPSGYTKANSTEVFDTETSKVIDGVYDNSATSRVAIRLNDPDSSLLAIGTELMAASQINGSNSRFAGVDGQASTGGIDEGGFFTNGTSLTELQEIRYGFESTIRDAFGLPGLPPLTTWSPPGTPTLDGGASGSSERFRLFQEFFKDMEKVPSARPRSGRTDKIEGCGLMETC